jgi:hypothetical protein
LIRQPTPDPGHTAGDRPPAVPPGPPHGPVPTSHPANAGGALPGGPGAGTTDPRGPNPRRPGPGGTDEIDTAASDADTTAANEAEPNAGDADGTADETDAIGTEAVHTDPDEADSEEAEPDRTPASTDPTGADRDGHDVTDPAPSHAARVPVPGPAVGPDVDLTSTGPPAGTFATPVGPTTTRPGARHDGTYIAKAHHPRPPVVKLSLPDGCALPPAPAAGRHIVAHTALVPGGFVEVDGWLLVWSTTRSGRFVEVGESVVIREGR